MKLTPRAKSRPQWSKHGRCNVENHRDSGQTPDEYRFGVSRDPEIAMLVVEQYFRTGLLVYLWSKYLWQQILERRQRNIFNAFKVAPPEIREIMNDEEYENRRTEALHRSAFEIFKGTLDVGLATAFIMFQGFRKIWEKSSDVVAYFNIQDSEKIVRNALFLTLLTSGTFVVSLPFTMLELYSRQAQNTEKRTSATRILLDHCVAQTLLFPFVCLFVLAFKLGGDKTMLWVFGFAEFQLLNEFLLDGEPIRRLEDDALRRELADIAKKFKFPLQDVFVTQRASGRRLATLRGFPRSRNVVLDKELILVEATNGLANFTSNEISAIVARELSHWRRNHSLVNFIIDQTHLCLRLYTMHRFLNSERLYRAFDFENRPLAIGLTLLQYCPLFDLYNFVARTISRTIEFLADQDVKRIHGDASLKSAIIKMSNNTKMFPIQDSLYSACWSSEASCYERIIALNEYEPS